VFTRHSSLALIVSMVLIAPVRSSALPVEWGEVSNHRGVAILVHGLNNTPRVMRPIGAVLRSIGFTTGIVTLGGHAEEGSKIPVGANDWVDAIRDAAQEAAVRYPGTPLLGVGFSLGGTVCLQALDSGAADFRRLILIAPAIGLKGYTSFARLVTWLRIFGVSIPSFIPPEYRSSSTTPLKHYASLFELVDRLRTTRLDRKTTTTPGLIVLRDTDEFVSRSRTERFRLESGFEQWRILSLGRGGTELPEHLLVDERSFGSEGWRRFVDEISVFLRDF